MTRTIPELVPHLRASPTPAGGRLVIAYDLTLNRSITRRIFSGIGSRTWNPPARSRDLTSSPPRPRPRIKENCYCHLLALVAESRFRHRRVEGSKLDSREDPPWLGARGSSVLPLVWCGCLQAHVSS
ncbi:hypothetical protein AVEN_114375-1 [Araneus ventricosus]|uniref:Uncharacterized protein n=1 Tax=Araneus ventricosus TaxID=182803 RepID=A0A4Y2SIA5_ARAVE|nr:hypothetical protein AVEN_45263-1 [Araneus ventricosus]GBN87988.1 hypothetical protein AVEN_114375-1 [Araneus ventricosus]